MDIAIAVRMTNLLKSNTDRFHSYDKFRQGIAYIANIKNSGVGMRWKYSLFGQNEFKRK